MADTGDGERGARLGVSGGRLLLTGATGFVGTHLRAALQSRYPDLDVVGTSSTAIAGCRALDLRDASGVDALVAELRPDIVVHLAAQSSVGLSAKDVGATWSVNLGGSMNLALAVARHCPGATVLFASSAEVYGASFLNGPASESTPLLPMNAYAKSKAAAERMFADVLPPTARLIVARPFNHTGPGQREDFVLASFAAQIARIEAGLQPPELRVGNLDVRRDFLDVRDVMEAYCALLDAGPRLPQRLTCNVASGTSVALKDFVKTLIAISGHDISVKVDSLRFRQGELASVIGDISFIKAIVPWYPKLRDSDFLSALMTYARGLQTQSMRFEVKTAENR